MCLARRRASAEWLSMRFWLSIPNHKSHIYKCKLPTYQHTNILRSVPHEGVAALFNSQNVVDCNWCGDVTTVCDPWVCDCFCCCLFLTNCGRGSLKYYVSRQGGLGDSANFWFLFWQRGGGAGKFLIFIDKGWGGFDIFRFFSDKGGGQIWITCRRGGGPSVISHKFKLSNLLNLGA